MSELRAWTAAVLFGTLWGTLEVSLGSALHLSRFPLRGLIMSSLGLLCLITLSRLSPRVGNSILAGLVAAFIKIFALGGLYPGPLIGILLEALVVELLLDLGGVRFLTAMTAGACVLALTPLQMAVTVRLLSGPDAIVGLNEFLGMFLKRVGLPPVSIGMMLLSAAAVAAIAGVAAGWGSWKISSRVLRRMEGSL